MGDLISWKSKLISQSVMMENFELWCEITIQIQKRMWKWIVQFFPVCYEHIDDFRWDWLCAKMQSFYCSKCGTVSMHQDQLWQTRYHYSSSKLKIWLRSVRLNLFLFNFGFSQRTGKNNLSPCFHIQFNYYGLFADRPTSDGSNWNLRTNWINSMKEEKSVRFWFESNQMLTESFK